MRVVSKKTKHWSQRFICKECGSVLEVKKEDLHVLNTAVGYAGETWEPEVAFTCIVCDSANYVTGDIPYGIERQLIEIATKRQK